VPIFAAPSSKAPLAPDAHRERGEAAVLEGAVAVARSGVDHAIAKNRQIHGRAAVDRQVLDFARRDHLAG
jgi:hypothetical protein